MDTRDGEAGIKKSESVLRHHCGQDGQHAPMKALGAERRRAPFFRLSVMGHSWNPAQRAVTYYSNSAEKTHFWRIMESLNTCKMGKHVVHHTRRRIKLASVPANRPTLACMHCVGCGAFKRAKVCCEPYLASRRPFSAVGFQVLELETNINLKGERQCPEV